LIAHVALTSFVGGGGAASGIIIPTQLISAMHSDLSTHVSPAKQSASVLHAGTAQ
jgi:hypothetical protein